MSKIFISHSSKDGDFAKKLAIDLLLAELPIWLDTYELTIGDSLYSKIFSGINASNFLIVILSKNYNLSLWTSKEFKTILTKEDQDNKKYLIPIKIDESKVPLEIGDRIYKEFFTDYRSSVKYLIRYLRKEDLSIRNIPINERQIILSFDKHTEINIQLIKSVLTDLHEKPAAIIVKKQIYFEAYEHIDHLVTLGEKNVKSLNNTSLTNEFKESSQRVENLINNLEEGILLILNEYKKDCHIDYISISLYWFSRMIMVSIYSLLTRYLHADELDNFDLKADHFTYMPANNSISFPKFYETNGYARLDIFDKLDTSKTCAISVDDQCFAYLELKELIFPIPFRSSFSIDLMYKYLIPQNILSRVINGKHIAILNDFDNYQVGLR